MRYIKGENPTKLGLEFKNLGFIGVNSNNSIVGSIYRYKKQYDKEGIKGLISKAGKSSKARKPRKPAEERYKDWTKEELIQHINDLESWFEKNDKSKKSKYKYIKNHYLVSKYKYFRVMEVSKSGYYSWIKNGEKISGKYDKKLLEQIKFLFYLKKQKFGFKRIKILLETGRHICLLINYLPMSLTYLQQKVEAI